MNEKAKTPTKETRPIALEILDALLKEYRGPEDFFAQGGLLKFLVKGLIARAMQAEMTANVINLRIHSRKQALLALTPSPSPTGRGVKRVHQTPLK